MSRLNLIAVNSLIGLALVGCGAVKKLKNKGSDSKTAAAVTPLAPGQALVSASDIVATPGFTINPVTEAELIKRLNEDNSLYSNQPDAATPSTCDKQINAVTVQANAKSLLISATLDTTACSNAQADKDSTFKVTQSTSKIRYYVECTSGDLSTLNGKTVEDFNNIDGNKLCTNGTILSESVFSFSVSGTDPNSAQALKIESTSIDFSGDPQLKGCKFSTVNNISSDADGCIDISKSDTTTTSGDSVTKAADFKKYTKTGLRSDVASKSNVWYSAGTIGVVYNDWTGMLTYTGVASVPSYELTQKEARTPITGKLTATASALLLSESAHKVERRLLGRISNIFGGHRSH